MKQGFERRPEAQDNLKGMAQVEPVMLQGTNPRVLNPAPTRLPQTTFDREIADQVGNFLQGKLAEAVQKNQQRRLVEGQIAHHQGRTIEELEMAGDKWALEGYRMVEAQTLASSMFRAMEQDIRSGGYATSPEGFREDMGNRLAAALEGVEDRRTADLIREHFSRQLPSLVDVHTRAHYEYLEQQNFETLERAVDVISRDPSNIDELIAFARGGEGTATAGLSDDRRRVAVVSGVIRAFDNDNPLAYAALAREGLLGDNLTTDQINAVRAAKDRYEARARSEYNAELFEAQQDLSNRVEQGLIDPSGAVAELSSLLAEHNLTMRAQEAGAIYTDARQTERIVNRTNAVMIEEARLRGDFDTVAEITGEAVVWRESRGRRDAVGPVVTGGANAGDRARSEWQVMPITARDPGFGVRPAQDDSLEEYARVGRDYWRAMVNRYEGDVEAAAIAYNAGPGNADRWLEAGRDYSVLPDRAQTEPYTQDILNKLDGWEAPTPADRLRRAEGVLRDTRERLAMDTFEAITPGLLTLDEQFRRREITEDAWRAGRQELFDQHGAERDMNTVRHEVALAHQVSEALISEGREGAHQRTMYAAGLEMQALSGELESASERWSRNEFTDEERAFIEGGGSVGQLAQAALTQFTRDRDAIMQEYGIPFQANDQLRAVNQATELLDRAMQRGRQHAEDGLLIEQAIDSGTLGQLSPELQQRAIREHRDRTAAILQDQVAEGTMTEQEAGAAFDQEQGRFYGEAGVVDPDLQRVMLGYLGQEWVVDGQANPRAAEAIGMAREIWRANPAMLERYIPDASMREEVMLAINRANNGPIEDVIGAMRRGDRQGSLPSREAELRERAALRELRVSALNAARSTQVRVWGQVFQPSTNFLGVGLAPDTGLIGAALTRRAEPGQILDRSRRQRDALNDPDGQAQTMFREAVAARAEEVMLSHRGQMTPSEALTIAEQEIQTRGAFIGQDFVMWPEGESIYEAFFGSEAPNIDTVDAANRVVMDILRSDEFREQNPQIGDTTGFMDWWRGNIPLGEQMRNLTGLGTGARPFVTGVAPDASGRPGLAIYIMDDYGGYLDPVILTQEQMRDAGMRHIQRTQR